MQRSTQFGSGSSCAKVVTNHGLSENFPPHFSCTWCIESRADLCRRYGSKLKELRAIFSEYGLIRFRTLVECRWLQMLADLPEVTEVPPFDEATMQLLERFGTDFSLEDAQEVKNVGMPGFLSLLL